MIYIILFSIYNFSIRILDPIIAILVTCIPILSVKLCLVDTLGMSFSISFFFHFLSQHLFLFYLNISLENVDCMYQVSKIICIRIIIFLNQNCIIFKIFYLYVIILRVEVDIRSVYY